MKIHDYARSGDIEGIRREMERGESLEAYDDRGETPLMGALQGRYTSVEKIRSILALGADVNAISGESKRGYSWHKSALTIAIRSCSQDTIKALLAAGADIEYVDPEGYSVLISAIGRDFRESPEENFQLIKSLVEAGAPLDCKTSDGDSALSKSSDRGEFKIVDYLLEKGADPSPLHWNELFMAVAQKDLSLLKTCVIDHTLLNARDSSKRTPFLLAIHTGSLDIAKYLLKCGSDLHAKGQLGTTAILYALDADNPRLLQWLAEQGCDVEACNENGTRPLDYSLFLNSDVECVRILLAAGAKIIQQGSYGNSTISSATHPEVVKLLVAHGANLSDCSAHRYLFPYPEPLPIVYSDPEVRQYQHRIFGSHNPERMNNPFWDVMIQSRKAAYGIANSFGNTEASRNAIWCYSRCGQSLTELPDGRYVEIGGEFEDWYYPDFCIYNDVVVHHGDGTFDIFGYPKEIFPPTDFHSATLVGRDIYVIGGLGYQGERTEGITPVFKLSIDTFHIERVECSGIAPGWIHKHLAKLLDDQVIEITYGEVMHGKEWKKNDRVFHLDLKTKTWTVLPQ